MIKSLEAKGVVPLAIREPLTKVCKYCGIEFKTHNKKQIVCSQECNIKHISIEKLSLAYRKDELPVKERLEMLLNTSFNKEHINNTYVDFANENYLIEYTADRTCGMYEAINRLHSINDKRKKILISHTTHLGSVGLSRCDGIELIPIENFWKDNFKF